MNILSNSVYNYYLSHFDELTLDKQFHFASRLYAISKDEKANEMLQLLKAKLIGEGSAEQVVSALHSGRLFPLLPGNVELLAVRAPYIKKYPQLRDTSRLLYWSAMLSYAYKFETKNALSGIITDNELENLYHSLLDDHEAIATLSTHAVNYLYLYTRYCKNEPGPDPVLFSQILSDSSYYNYSNPVQLRLAVYMITHALIADTLFYFEPVPKSHAAQHKTNIQQLELLIADRLDLLSLDAKLEFILCCKLVGHISPLEHLILDESRFGLSSTGDFIVDPSNTSQSLNSSEHRNVLYLLCMNTPTLL